MERFFAKGLASSTQRTYKSAQKRYLQFCKDGAFIPLPSSQSILCRFVSHLANQGLKHRTIKAYLSAVRFLHIAEGREDPFISHFPRLQYTLSGINPFMVKFSQRIKKYATTFTYYFYPGALKA